MAAEALDLRLRLGNPLQPEPLVVPEVDVVVGDGGPPRVEWVEGRDRESPSRLEALDDFLALDRRPTDHSVAKVASRWGPLGICKHGRPSTHEGCKPLESDSLCWEDREGEHAYATRFAVGEGEDSNSVSFNMWRNSFWEPFHAWRFYARQFAATLRIAAALRAGIRPRTDDWTWSLRAPHPGVPLDPRTVPVQDQLFAPLPRSDEVWQDIASGRAWEELPTDRERGLASTRAPLEELGRVLTEIANAHLDQAGIRLRVQWQGGSPEIGMTLGGRMVPEGVHGQYTWPGGTLYGTLAALLVARVLAPGGVYRCSRCGSTYTSERKARSDQPHYCSKACFVEARRERQRVAKRERRALARTGATATS